MTDKLKYRGFTLIELLMVIAIIGILAGILIPAVGSVRKQANVSASKAQISNYINALELFKGEYKFYPFVTSNSDTDIRLLSDSSDFIRTLSAREPTTGSKVSANGNRRQISFMSFSESDFWVDAQDNVTDNQLADRFNNRNIILRVDGNGDGRVTVPSASQSGQTQDVKASIAAYVEEDDTINAPAYYLYD